MHIYAGKTAVSRYDHRAPIHLALDAASEDETQDPRSVCANKPITPLTAGWPVTVTCPVCAASAAKLHDLIG